MPAAGHQAAANPAPSAARPERTGPEMRSTLRPLRPDKTTGALDLLERQLNELPEPIRIARITELLASDSPSDRVAAGSALARCYHSPRVKRVLEAATDPDCDAVTAKRLLRGWNFAIQQAMRRLPR